MTYTIFEQQNERKEIKKLTSSMVLGEFQEYGLQQVARPVYESIHNDKGFSEQEVINWYGEVPEYWEYDCICTTGIRKGIFGLYRHESTFASGATFYPIKTLPKLVGVMAKEEKTFQKYILELDRIEKNREEQELASHFGYVVQYMMEELSYTRPLCIYRDGIYNINSLGRDDNFFENAEKVGLKLSKSKINDRDMQVLNAEQILAMCENERPHREYLKKVTRKLNDILEGINLTVRWINGRVGVKAKDIHQNYFKSKLEENGYITTEEKNGFISVLNFRLSNTTIK